MVVHFVISSFIRAPYRSEYLITPETSYSRAKKENANPIAGQCSWFGGNLPRGLKTAAHAQWMFTAQLVCQGMCKQAEIIRALGVSKNSVSRSVKKFREGGPDAFFARPKGRGGSVITEELKARAQEMLNSGESRRDVAEALEADPFRHRFILIFDREG
jgi:DNA-binding transcriptional regulator YdaS (Cro superfamily)